MRKIGSKDFVNNVDYEDDYDGIVLVMVVVAVTMLPTWP